MSEKPQKEKKIERKITVAGVIEEAGSSVANKTGTWRTFRPSVSDKCTGCSICTWYCPEGGIKVVEKEGKKKAVVDYEHCKGCMICLEVCPAKAINKEKEK